MFLQGSVWTIRYSQLKCRRTLVFRGIDQRWQFNSKRSQNCPAQQQPQLCSGQAIFNCINNYNKIMRELCKKTDTNTPSNRMVRVYFFIHTNRFGFFKPEFTWLTLFDLHHNKWYDYVARFMHQFKNHICNRNIHTCDWVHGACTTDRNQCKTHANHVRSFEFSSENEICRHITHNAVHLFAPIKILTAFERERFLIYASIEPPVEFNMCLNYCWNHHFCIIQVLTWFHSTVQFMVPMCCAIQSWWKWHFMTNTSRLSSLYPTVTTSKYTNVYLIKLHKTYAIELASPCCLSEALKWKGETMFSVSRKRPNNKSIYVIS